jgi:hypothetical protein
MENKRVIYSIEIKIHGVRRGDNEPVEDFEKKVAKIAKNRLSNFLTGHLLDPEKKVITEKIIYQDNE